MTDIEIDRALALAIGWKSKQILKGQFGLMVMGERDDNHFTRQFSHKDWNVIGPIAARYNCFPEKNSDIFGGEYWSVWLNSVCVGYADIPQKATALAVIEVANK